ncbi:MAG: hypothetical protein N3D11_16845 [Candidatus Sumerlaeia bacterium]|nr:hypothetical protein [Candidatus Sumerlaeia bacterium]
MAPLKKMPKMFTKTQLRRGEIEREKSDPQHSAEIIDFLPAVHGDVEDILCDLSADMPDPPDAPLS